MYSSVIVATRITSLLNFKTGRDLAADEKAQIDGAAGLSRLTLRRITADQAGKYAVAVENALGSDCRFASVAVEGPPEPPCEPPSVTAVRCETGDYGASVTWCSPAYDGGCALTGYTVECRRIGELVWRVVAENCHSLSHETGPLRPGAAYLFRVRALNVHGPGEPSPESRPLKVPFLDMEVAEDKLKVEEDQANMEDENDEDYSTDKMVELEEGSLFKERYALHEELGKGRYGVVRRAVEKKSEKTYAAKFVRTVKSSDRLQVREEIKIMNILRHPKLLRLAAAFESPKEIVMVTEYISGGELFERVVADDFTLTEKDSILFMRQICEGVRYMHENNIVHLDLKPENIMCHTRTSHRIKLIDFGLAQILSPHKPVRVLFGTPEFIPPEIINYEPISTETDMWSVGVICYVLLTGLSPFMGDNDAETFANIVRADYDFEDEAFDAISPDAKDFISNLLQKKKELRMSAKQCLSHSWLAQHTENMSQVALPTEKLKKFIVRRKWQKTGNALRALGRMAMLSANRRSPSLSPTSTRSLSEVARSESLDSEEHQEIEDSISKDHDDSVSKYHDDSIDLSSSDGELLKKVEELKVSETPEKEEIVEEVLMEDTPEDDSKIVVKERQSVNVEKDVYEPSQENSVQDNIEKLDEESKEEIDEVVLDDEKEEGEVVDDDDKFNANQNGDNVEDVPVIEDEEVKDQVNEEEVLNIKEMEDKDEGKTISTENENSIEEESHKIESNTNNKADEVIKNVEYDSYKKKYDDIQHNFSSKSEEFFDSKDNNSNNLPSAKTAAEKTKFSSEIGKIDVEKISKNGNIIKEARAAAGCKENKDTAFSERELFRRSFRKFTQSLEVNSDEDTRLDESPSRARRFVPTGNVSRTAKLFEKLETEQAASGGGNGVATPPSTGSPAPNGKQRSERIQKAFAFWNK